MTDRVLSMPVHGAVTCAQLPGREVAVARREMVHTSGGLSPIGKGPFIPVLALLIAEAINDYLDDGN